MGGGGGGGGGGGVLGGRGWVIHVELFLPGCCTCFHSHDLFGGSCLEGMK